VQQLSHISSTRKLADQMNSVPVLEAFVSRSLSKEMPNAPGCRSPGLRNAPIDHAAMQMTVVAV
jgi:hypothetical protein